MEASHHCCHLRMFPDRSCGARMWFVGVKQIVRAAAMQRMRDVIERRDPRAGGVPHSTRRGKTRYQGGSS